MRAESFMKKLSKKGVINEAEYRSYGRQFETITFNDPDDANQYMEDNPEWGVIGEDPDGTIHVARMDDEGTEYNQQGQYNTGFDQSQEMNDVIRNDMMETIKLDKILCKVVESGMYSKKDLVILEGFGISKKGLRMFKESTVSTKKAIKESVEDSIPELKALTESVNKLLNR